MSAKRRTISKLNWRLREFILAMTRRLARVGVRASPHIAGKVDPLGGTESSFLQHPGDHEETPPAHLWVRYADTAEQYLAAGREDMASIIALLEKNGVGPPPVVLELGCAAGRLTRHFPRTEDSEIWGADVSAPHIAWCQRNLPDLNFVTVSTAPHLPFEDGHFDFVFCASVFTHISDLADAWLLEIRRVLKPGGHLYLTVHDKVSAMEMQTVHAQWVPGRNLDRLASLEAQSPHGDWEMYYFDADPYSQVFYDRDYITRKWSRWMRFVAYEERFHNYQAAMLFEKPSVG